MYYFEFPKQIEEKIRQRKLRDQADEFIGQAGYVSPNNEVLRDALAALSLGKHVLLKGPTGAGKTKLAEMLSSILHLPMQSVNCSVDLDSEALLGFKTLREGEIVFVDGPVVSAMKKGHLLYIDEINMAKPETLPILNGILDYRKQITNPFTQEVVKANDDFAVVAAINEGYIGTTVLNEALKNRFIVIEVPYLSGDRLKQLLIEQSIQKDVQILEKFVTLSEDLIFQVTAGELSEEAGSIRALLDAADLTVLLPPERAIRRAIADKLEQQRERDLIMNLAETLF